MTVRKGGIGTSVGRIVLSSIEYVKPELSKSLAYMDEVEARKGKNKPGLVGFQHFQKARYVPIICSEDSLMFASVIFFAYVQTNDRRIV